ncbi:MAG: hypothetical protein KIT11_09150 [Fimbriimonadaceae bacterium]|nr:hypothetical protein [Fimbriimonadaceae bacterium]QYK55494.1 MAG: hypothetical protein KF733_10820 [Fimbriimonadaceae bacterium]
MGENKLSNKKHRDQSKTLEVLRRAAEVGPGLRGKRLSASPGEKDRLRRSLAEAGLQAPAYLEARTAWVDREALLFRAGDYPDKGLTVTDAHLRNLAETFDLPVPILIEHSRSPLELGFLTDVRADGDTLHGTVALSREASDLIDRSGAHGLSLGLSSDLCEIREVSLVREPRVEGARLFTRGPVFSGELASPGPGWIWSRIAELEGEGRIVPAQRPFLTALLECTKTVTFDGASVPVAHLAVRLLESAPKSALFAETAPATAPGSTPELEPDEADFYTRHFPGLDLEKIARNRRGRR